MRFRTFIGCIVFIGFLSTCAKEHKELTTPSIIPIPVSFENRNGTFTIDTSTGLFFEPEFDVSANFLRNYIEEGSGLKLKDNNDMQIVKDSTLNSFEGYKLYISERNIKISAKTDQGAFYAIQTLRQLLPATLEAKKLRTQTLEVPCLTIEDQPYFKYRGMHLDVGRHFYDIDFIKKYIDALAMLKMNRFHWHLTEDQGWRIEIKKYPKLQEVAAYRDQTLIGHYSEQPQRFDNKRYGGYYTQEEIREVVAYAKARHVTIIPEIEMPGHAQAAIAAYPELGCKGNPVEVATKWGVFETIYCTKEANFEFLENVLDEVMQLFPSTYIHIGGDEAPKDNWKACRSCQQRINEEGLKGEDELQSYFIRRIEGYLNKNGRQIIGWDEILEGGLAPNATVMSWRGVKGAIDAAQEGHDVILTPNSHAYFDHYQSDHPDEPLAIGGFLPLEKVYHFSPIPAELAPAEKKHVLGAQGNVWTEYMPKSDQVEYMAFPRMLAMSEVVWSMPEHKNYLNFVKRLEYFMPRLEALDIHYANHLYDIESHFISKDQSKLKLETPLNTYPIRYTLDGTEPTINSKIYEDIITLKNSITIKAAVFNDQKRIGRVHTETFNLHKAVGQDIRINVEPSKTYSGSGAKGLVNGVSGSDTRYGDKEWLGFSGKDIELSIDFNKATNIKSICTRFYNGTGQWIYVPKQVQVSINDRPFETFILSSSDELLVDFEWYESASNVSKIELKIPNFGIIPEGKQGAGHKAWTFIDEIIVK